jgi:hypothetical protein
MREPEFRVQFLEHSVEEIPCVADESVMGRVSVADASLSLSLSAPQALGPSVRPFGRPVSPQGDMGSGVGALGAGARSELSPPRALCPGWLSHARGPAGRSRADRSRRGWM